MRASTKVIGAVVVSAATVALLLKIGDYRIYMAYLAKADYWKLWPLLFVSPFAQVLRSYRVGLLLSPNPPLLDRELYRISSFHMLLSGLLPMRAGELALPAFLKYRRNVPLSTGTGYVLVARVFDMGMVGIITGVAGALVLPDPWYLLGLLTTIGSFAGLMLMPLIASHLRKYATGKSGKLWGVIAGLAEGAAVLRDQGRWAMSWAASLLIWMCIFASYYFCSEAIAHIPFSVLVLAGGAASVAVAQPVNGLAGLGPFQAAWAWVATSMGVDWHAAVATGLIVHLGQLGASAFNAAIASAVTFRRPSLSATQQLSPRQHSQQ